jgi:DNA primase
MWLIFAVGKSSLLELRALPPNGITPIMKPVTKHFRAADYKDVEVCKSAFEQEALRLNADGYNTYTVMNPIKLTFTGYAAKDDDIAYRDLLLVDIDRAVKKTEPASDAEIECARLTANELQAYLSSCGFPTPFRVMSGNGHHLYYVLQDVPNTPEATSTVHQVLQNLAARFDNANVKIDTSVFNASRITKVPGTIMRKGAESLLRPYRMAVVYEE